VAKAAPDGYTLGLANDAQIVVNPSLYKLPYDPADRLIIATALAQGAALMTADERLLGWGHALERHDARV
jgi:PIN domain nuclease of toxin-antitoxin system